MSSPRVTVASQSVVPRFLGFVVRNCRHATNASERLTFGELRQAFERYERGLGRQPGFIRLDLARSMVRALLVARFDGKRPLRVRRRSTGETAWTLAPRQPAGACWRTTPEGERGSR